MSPGERGGGMQYGPPWTSMGVIKDKSVKPLLHAHHLQNCNRSASMFHLRIGEVVVQSPLDAFKSTMKIPSFEFHAVDFDEE